MRSKKLNKLIGLEKQDFDEFLKNGQIQAQPVRLIPALKIGDEMALTSILLSAFRLIKEYRDALFKEIKLRRNGKIYYFREVFIPDVASDSRVDGLIIVVVKEVIVDAAFFEMKNKANGLDEEQVLKYIELCKKLDVNKLITVSNEFVPEPSASPLNIKGTKDVSLIHFSWTYLRTKGQLLLFKNDMNIDDNDQVEIMKEVLYFFESPESGIKGYTQMKPEWKELSESITASKPISKDPHVPVAVLSWQEEISDLALLLSRKLGVLVKVRTGDMKADIKKVIKSHELTSYLAIKDSVSDIKIKADFAKRVV